MNNVTQDSIQQVEAIARKGFVYPGHPLVVATLIMTAFDNFAQANKTTEHGWAAALSDPRIPGAGDHVGAALQTLRVGAGGGSIDAMVDHANNYWTRGQAGGHEKEVPAGLEQAKLIDPLFREIAATWLLKDTDILTDAPGVLALRMDKAALIQAGFVSTTYENQDGEFLRLQGCVEEFPYVREHIVDGDWVEEGMEAFFEVRPDSMIQLFIPDADYVESYEFDSAEGQALLKDALAKNSRFTTHAVPSITHQASR